ncbi:E3 ubiquitin-protein ligase XIAP-like isoform X2 [Haliotis rubra]|uniref:E3 ubiquitin-protein ligase XIAP-like isoform X2 n=1 Tax=Haliotis rubra TaxID=36100 RepID=UPI001EE57103|nr:E3 ubiquitin-protein ligase XIAP-like isoform X2 [Haliotis rubra]
MKKKKCTKDLVILWYGTILVIEVDRRMAVRRVFLLAIRNLNIHQQAESKPANVFTYWKSMLFSIIISVFPSISLRGDFDALVRRNGTLLQDIMRFEAMRCKSFNGMTIAVSALELARQGFYATGNEDETRCFSCGIRHRHWRQGDKPADVGHKAWCRDGFHWNIRFEENPLPTNSEMQTRNQLAFPTDFDIHRRRPDASSSSHTNPAVRQNNPVASGVNITQPTERTGAGFIYSGNRDYVQSHSCGMELGNLDIESVRRQQLHIELMVTIASQEIDERQDTFRLNCQEHELVEMFSRCLKLGFNQQEVERAALRVLNKTGTSSPTLLLLLDDLLRDRGSTVQFGDNATCKVCRKDAVNTIFLPCGHKLTCSKCASEIQDCLQISCGERIRGYLHFE